MGSESRVGGREGNKVHASEADWQAGNMNRTHPFKTMDVSCPVFKTTTGRNPQYGIDTGIEIPRSCPLPLAALLSACASSSGVDDGIADGLFHAPASVVNRKSVQSNLPNAAAVIERVVIQVGSSVGSIAGGKEESATRHGTRNFQVAESD